MKITAQEIFECFRAYWWQQTRFVDELPKLIVHHQQIAIQVPSGPEATREATKAKIFKTLKKGITEISYILTQGEEKGDFIVYCNQVNSKLCMKQRHYSLRELQTLFEGLCDIRPDSDQLLLFHVPLTDFLDRKQAEGILNSTFSLSASSISVISEEEGADDCLSFSANALMVIHHLYREHMVKKAAALFQQYFEQQGFAQIHVYGNAIIRLEKNDTVSCHDIPHRSFFRIYFDGLSLKEQEDCYQRLKPLIVGLHNFSFEGGRLILEIFATGKLLEIVKKLQEIIMRQKELLEDEKIHHNTSFFNGGKSGLSPRQEAMNQDAQQKDSGSSPTQNSYRS